MRGTRRVWQLVVLGVVAALVVSLAGAVGVPKPSRAAASVGDDNPEQAIPSEPLPPRVVGPDPEGALNDPNPETVVPQAIPEAEVVTEVVPPAVGDGDVGGEPVPPESDPDSTPAGSPVGGAQTNPASLRSGTT